MTDKPMLSVEREVIEKALRDALTIRFDTDSHVTKLRALLDKPNTWPCWSCKQPVSMRERADADGDCPHCSVELDIEDWPFSSKPAAQQQGEVERLRYKAELYDEVWQKARDMGFANVTDALAKLAAPFKPDTVVCRRYTLEGHIFYHYDLEPVYGSVPVTVSELINEAQVAVVLPERREPDPCSPYLSDSDIEWNAAIDAVTRLNTPQ